MQLEDSLEGLGPIVSGKRKGSFKSQVDKMVSDIEHQIGVVDTNEALASVRVDWLQHSMAALKEKAERDPGPCRKWVAEIQRILDWHLQRPNITIGLYGQTGSGKSSIISAICGRREIVHSNAMQAGTEFITVIGFNHLATPENAWRGEIQTITQDEWASELKILLQDLHNLPNAEIPSPSSSSEVRDAIAKILAVYPEAKCEEFRDWTSDDLANHASLRSVLDRAHRYSEPTLTDLKKRMEKFTGSRHRPKFSPLVSIMRIFGPIEFLRRGLEIADVPGLGDSNEARCRVAEEYQAKVDAFWIVSPIIRAVDDNIAKELFGTSRKHSMEIAGRLTEEHITFVMSKCDDVTVDQVIKDLDMTKDERVSSLRALEKAFDKDKLRTKLEAQLREVRGKNVSSAFKGSSYSSQVFDQEFINTMPANELGPKRSRKNISDPGFETESSCKRQKREDNSTRENDTMALVSKLSEQSISIDKLNSELLEMGGMLMKLEEQQQSHKSQLIHLAISARNAFSVTTIRANFAEELRGTNTVETAPKKNATLLPVFCVSSKAYEKYRGRNGKYRKVEGYPHLNDTQIPQLRENCIKIALTAQRKSAEDLSSGLSSLVDEMKTWAEDKEPEMTISMEQKDLLLKVFDDLFSKLSNTILVSPPRKLHEITGFLRNKLEAATAKAAPLASDAAVKVFEGWFKNGRKSWSWSTLRACAIRHGEPYQTRSLRHRSGVIELNAELAAGFRKSTAKVWASLLHEDMPDEKDRVGTQLKDALTQFLEQVDAAVTSACPSISSKWRLLQKTLRRLIGRTHMAINDTFNKLLRKFQQIERSIEQEVSKAMRATYDNCGNMAGEHSGDKIHKIMKEDIHSVLSPNMFENAANNMISTLEAVIAEAEKEIKTEHQVIITKFKDDYQEMVIAASDTVQSEGLRPKKTALQHSILEEISRLEEAQAHVQLHGPRNAGTLGSEKPFVGAAWMDHTYSSAQVGEDDYFSEESDDSRDE